ncbi:hypothetical protein QO003_000868 [Arthrobacter silviterrae]|uniref:Restriction endonuclease n=1 Tax=Arthrobacter silviterrae TaxID=2026658 RepID=A0ABX0DKK5_9MICC|nr:hypothetical protein [Arthrobacter silviterrae]MDQ0276565.1 hypothetical protein [Arthrobacter silviterrae]NGN84813.1 hypothetical protein [Arthrobacter silviterrae]
MAVKRTQADLLESARTQMGFLVDSCASFDQGKTNDALRIATSLRVLLHHNPARGTHALLAQCEMLENLFIRDTFGGSLLGGIPNDMLFIHTRVVDDEGKLEPKFQPRLWGKGGLTVTPPPTAQLHALLQHVRLPRGPRFHQPFLEWWNQIILQDQLSSTFTRQDIVLGLANKDGGAHVDPILTDKYYALTRQNSIGIFSQGNRSRVGLIWGDSGGKAVEKGMGNIVPADSPAFALARQIGWEFVESIGRAHPKVMP